MASSDPSSSLALDDIMLLEDEEEVCNSSESAKVMELQDQLQKQAEVIRDLMVQRDFLILQINQERDRWRAERAGWERTSEVLISQRSKKDSALPKDEDLEQRCAVYEADNKALKDKLHGTQSRFNDLQAELSKLRPLLLIQPQLPSLYPQQLQHSLVVQPYHFSQAQMQNAHASPSYVPTTSLVPTMQYHPTPLSLQTTSPTGQPSLAGKKRKRNESLSSATPPAAGAPFDLLDKGKEKELARGDRSDASLDYETETAETTPVPSQITTPMAHNPYSFMNNLYQRSRSSQKLTTILSSSIPASHLSTSAASSAETSSTHMTNAYPYSLGHPGHVVTTPNESQSISRTISRRIYSLGSRKDDSDKDVFRSHADNVTPSLFIKQDKVNPLSKNPESIRRKVAANVRKSQDTSKHRTSFMSDARSEHLLLAARKIGRERAALLAGLIKVQDPLTVDELSKGGNKEKAIGQSVAKGITATTTPTHSNIRALTSSILPIPSPTTPTPRRIHPMTGTYVSPLTDASIGTMSPSTNRTIDGTVSPVKMPRKDTTPNILDAEAEGTNIGLTALDSLLSAARKMMSKDHGSAHVPVKNVTTVRDDSIEGSATERRRSRKKRRDSAPKSTNIRRRHTDVSGAKEFIPLVGAEFDKSRGHVNLTRTISPSKRLSEFHHDPNSKVLGRTKSALDVLADQAAAAFEGSSPSTTGRTGRNLQVIGAEGMREHTDLNKLAPIQNENAGARIDHPVEGSRQDAGSYEPGRSIHMQAGSDMTIARAANAFSTARSNWEGKGAGQESTSSQDSALFGSPTRNDDMINSASSSLPFAERAREATQVQRDGAVPPNLEATEK
ncbi:hypothetical protein AMATHDRAFT_7656 [Amanita thiersii Skay4041]|uniref:Uncharacterized protein n=1 Tax=Amanita thiersii Skay4041 TaxID=703135 RepID=A0A2A9NFS7_9AGAR|nr:hypothetical protein AMATHDRAFT_7656 [Amanita thiersii Skay4041]